MTNANTYTLEAKGLHKVFPPATNALAGVDLRLAPGQIHGLLGVNGAGKSTLIKILAGVERADRGELVINGEPMPALASPKEAHDAGIGVVHQELPLLPNLTAAENAFLGAQSPRFLAPARRKEIERRYTDVARTLTGAPPASQRLSDVGPDRWQIVAVVRALAAGARVLILDEPTSSLGQRERASLHDALREVAGMGVAVLYVSHFLDDVLEVCDVVTVLRDSRVALMAATQGVTSDELLRAMTGDEAGLRGPRRANGSRGRDETRGDGLVVDDLTLGAIGPVSFEVGPHERVGLYGLQDCGAREILEALFGLRAHAGSASLAGRVLAGGPRQRIDQGLGYMPPERSRALIRDWSLAANLSLPSVGARAALAPLRRSEERKAGSAAVERFGIVGEAGQLARTLSGGNQQKVAVAKWMARGVECLLADEPTRGVDIRGRRMIYELLIAYSDDGGPVLVFSTDPEELVALCHRILVLEGGVVKHELERDGISVEALEELGRVRTAAGSGGGR
jgi:ABC-type sugar transport system ATPase subunit